MICKDCIYKADCKSEFEFCPFDGVKASEKHDLHISNCQHPNLMIVCTRCEHVLSLDEPVINFGKLITGLKTFRDIQELKLISSKERILNQFKLRLHPDEYDEKSVEKQAKHLDILLKHINNPHFLESLCDLLDDYSVEAEQIDQWLREDI
ncbi:MAG: hypothetical protein ACTSYA_01755 [Candidatus Kariarchaeaceae archaeon]